MTLIEDLQSLSQDQIEDIEKMTLRWVFQATLDFGATAHEIFLNSPDDVQDIAEDVTREILDRLPGFNVQERIYGKVDYKRARYVIMPEKVVRQALFVDAKAEKDKSSATLQMSQTSMVVRQTRAGKSFEENGQLEPVYVHAGKQFLSTTAFIHFAYGDIAGKHCLERATVFCVPNGKLQQRYNPSTDKSFWRAGRDAPKRREEFRVRVSFQKLESMASWRVQRLDYDPRTGECKGTWRA